ncbi:unnamed protein product, partial [Symbiodinium sp. KB8]
MGWKREPEAWQGQFVMFGATKFKEFRAKVGDIYNQMLTFYEDIYISELRDSLSKAALIRTQDIIINIIIIIIIIISIIIIICITRMLKGLLLCKTSGAVQAITVGEDTVFLLRAFWYDMHGGSVIRGCLEGDIAPETVKLADFRKNKTVIEADGEAQRYLIEQEALATAERNILDAQARSIEIVRNLVKIRNETEMSSDQLIKYQKLLMLQNKTGTNFMIQGSADPLAAGTARIVKQLTQ